MGFHLYRPSDCLQWSRQNVLPSHIFIKFDNFILIYNWWKLLYPNGKQFMRPLRQVGNAMVSLRLWMYQSPQFPIYDNSGPKCLWKGEWIISKTVGRRYEAQQDDSAMNHPWIMRKNSIHTWLGNLLLFHQVFVIPDLLQTDKKAKESSTKLLWKV